MVELKLSVRNKDGEILAESSGEESIYLLYKSAYVQGDRIELAASSYPQYIVWQVDDALGSAMCYVTENVSYLIPFDEKKKVYSPKTFSWDRHYLYARLATDEEINSYRNLSVNSADQHDVRGCYPHASANVETRGESVFAARNAIDGLHENHGHGKWPYTSWGINRDPNAEMKIEFGRTVEVDCIQIFLRADFPHDSYWTQGVVRFSDGSSETLSFRKTDKGQLFTIQPRKIDWLTLGELIKNDDESPFPALTQIEVYGKDIGKMK